MSIAQTMFGHLTFLPPSTKCWNSVNHVPTCVTQLYNSSFMVNILYQKISQSVYEKEKIKSPLILITIFTLYRYVFSF